MLSADTKKLENAYAVFNQEYFDNGLPVAMITIQSSRGAYGHCTTQKVWASGEGRYYELNPCDLDARDGSYLLYGERNQGYIQCWQVS